MITEDFLLAFLAYIVFMLWLYGWARWRLKEESQ